MSTKRNSKDKEELISVDPRVAELESWEKILRLPEFRVVEEYRDYRVNLLKSQVEELGHSPSHESGIKIMSLLSRIEEIKSFFNKANFKLEEAKKMKENKE